MATSENQDIRKCAYVLGDDGLATWSDTHADAWIGLHQPGSDCRVAEDEQDLIGELETGLAGSGGVVDGSEERYAAGAKGGLDPVDGGCDVVW